MTNKDKGNKLEELVVSYLKKYDPKARRTRGSGCGNERTDVVTTLPFRFECKKRNKLNVTIDSKVWQHLCFETAMDKIPVLCSQNEKNETFITLDIRDFFTILGQIYVK